MRKQKIKRFTRGGYRSTPPRIVIDDQPLTADDDEDDELLLTSKGWDWDPRCARLKYDLQNTHSFRKAKSA